MLFWQPTSRKSGVFARGLLISWSQFSMILLEKQQIHALYDLKKMDHAESLERAIVLYSN